MNDISVNSNPTKVGNRVIYETSSQMQHNDVDTKDVATDKHQLKVKKKERQHDINKNISCTGSTCTCDACQLSQYFQSSFRDDEDATKPDELKEY